MNWYIKALKQYTDFGGRARRKEYWFFTLFNILFTIVISVFDVMFGTIDMQTGVGLLGVVYMLLLLIPGTAVLVRRLHDTGRSAWWLLMFLIPLLGFVVLFIFLLLDSEDGENEYGPNPKTE